MAAATFRTQSGGGQSASPMGPSYPAGAVVGDLFVFVAYSRNTLPTIVSDGGRVWTQIDTQDNGAGAQGIAAWWAVENVGSGTPITVTNSNSGCFSVLVYETGTFDSTTPIETSVDSAYHTGSSPFTIPTITTVLDDVTRVVCLGATDDAATRWDGPSGFTTRADHATAAGSDTGLRVNTLVDTTAGVSPSEDVTQSAATVLSLLHFGIRPVPPLTGVINAAVSGLAGTVTGSTGAGATGQVTAATSGLNGSVSARFSLPAQSSPRREYVWVSNLLGVQVGVIT